MDNRRFSARADTGATLPVRRENVASPLLDRVFDLTRVNWEVLLFAGLMVMAIITRLWDLGSRAFHHDEAIHAYFSNYFLRTGSFTTTPGFQGGYDPTYHGPFLYHANGLAYFLFGTTDAIARLMPALFGIALVGLCWYLRPFIGRIAAVVAALLIVISPSISYYSRSLRHDIFALTGTMMLFIGILWFLRTHQAKWIYLGIVGFAIAFSSHELTFIIAFIFTLFLAIAAFAWRTFAPAYDASSRTVREGDDINPVRSALASLGSQRWTLIAAALLFLAIYVVLYTNLLTKPYLVLSGVVNGLTYWLGEHRVARGNQPHFYYLMLMLFYEPLAFIAGFGTIGYLAAKWLRRDGLKARPADDVDATVEDVDEYGHTLPSIGVVRGLTLGFLAFWSIGALIAFSIAGERMPWLNMQIALPFTLLAAAGIGRLVRGVEWDEVWRSGGVYLGVVVILFIFSAFSFMAHLNGTMPAAVGASADIQNTMRGVLLFLFTLGLLALAGWLAYKMLPGRAVKVVVLTFATLLTLYGIRSMSLVNYRHGDVPTEMLVYTQSAPDVPIVAAMIERLSRDETAFDSFRNANDPTGGHGLTISIDQNDAIEWPFDWYFRDMKDLKYFNLAQWESNQANVVPPNVPVIIASEATNGNDNFQNFVRDKYTSQRYVLNWWFPEDVYRKNGQNDLGTALDWMRTSGLKYFLYRDAGQPLGSRNFYLFVRNDLAVKTGLSGPSGVIAAPPPAVPSEPDPNSKIHGMYELSPAGTERGQFNLPRGIAVGPDGSFYVVDTANMRIQKFDSTGKWTQIIGAGKGAGDGQFTGFSDEAVGTGPGGIAVDPAGNIYVADTWNHRVQKFDKDGKFLTKWGEFISLGDPASANDPARDTKFFGPRGIAVGPDGNVYVTDTGNKRVLIFDANGKFVRKIDSGMSSTKLSPNYPFTLDGELNEPIGIAVDSGGNVYVADTNNKRIQKFDTTGKFVAKWAVPGTNWDVGAYLEPFLAVDASGVYATAPTGQKVIKFSPTGELLAEKSSEGAVSLKTPTGIAVGADGIVYVVDTGSNGVINLGKVQAP